jgi:hypothetical protein
MSDDLTGLAMAPRRSSGGPATLVLLTLVLALGAYAARGTIVQLAEKDVSGTGHPVSGTVVDAETGEPIRGAHVTSQNSGRVIMLPGAWSDDARTDWRGEFTVRATEEGESGSVIYVTAPGYVAHENPVRFDDRLTIKLSRSDPSAGD